MIAWLLLSMIPLFICFSLTPLFRAIALRFDIGDHPTVRKVHTGFIPRLGVAGIIAGFFVGVLAYRSIEGLPVDGYAVSLPVLCIATALIIFLGVFDDIYGVGSLGKLIVQSAASGLVVYAGLRIDALGIPFVGSIQLDMFGIPLTFLWLIGVTNAVNLLDGLDGLACGVSVIVSAAFFASAVVNYDPLVMVITASLFFSRLGFLRYNFHRASIFMSDTGSLFLGFVLACISLRVLQHANQMLWYLTLCSPRFMAHKGFLC